MKVNNYWRVDHLLNLQEKNPIKQMNLKAIHKQELIIRNIKLLIKANLKYKAVSLIKNIIKILKNRLINFNYSIAKIYNKEDIIIQSSPSRKSIIYNWQVIIWESRRNCYKKQKIRDWMHWRKLIWIMRSISIN